VNIPGATSVGASAFENTALTGVDLPAATSIDDSAFEGCTSLAMASLDAAVSIGKDVFLGTDIVPLYIILPTAAPVVDTGSSIGTNYTKTITIKRPSSSTSYDDSWQTIFKEVFGTSATITLEFEDL
jgi:hypothetical protein